MEFGTDKWVGPHGAYFQGNIINVPRQNSLPAVIFSIGHSSRSIGGLLAMLGAAGVKSLIDVRAQPGSQRYPHFQSDALRRAVNASGMDYHWAGQQFGGRRQARPKSVHTALSSGGERGFAEYMQTGEFRRAINKLVHMAHGTNCALLRAEKKPTDRHRALIANYLSVIGVRVLHLIESDWTAEHKIYPMAHWDDMTLIYNRLCQPPLPLED